MPNERTPLRKQVVSILKSAGIPNIGEKIFSWKLNYSSKADGDHILIYTPEEDAAIRSTSTSQYERNANLLVEIRAVHADSGEELAARLDLYCAAVETIILSDRFLGTFDNEDGDLIVSDTVLTGTDIDSDTEGESYILHAKMPFNVQYFTSEARNIDTHVALKRIFTEIEVLGNDSAKDIIELAQ